MIGKAASRGQETQCWTRVLWFPFLPFASLFLFWFFLPQSRNSPMAFMDNWIPALRFSLMSRTPPSLSLTTNRWKHSPFDDSHCNGTVLWRQGQFSTFSLSATLGKSVAKLCRRRVARVKLENAVFGKWCGPFSILRRLVRLADSGIWGQTEWWWAMVVMIFCRQKTKGVKRIFLSLSF